MKRAWIVGKSVDPHLDESTGDRSCPIGPICFRIVNGLRSSESALLEIKSPNSPRVQMTHSNFSFKFSKFLLIFGYKKRRRSNQLALNGPDKWLSIRILILAVIAIIITKRQKSQSNGLWASIAKPALLAIRIGGIATASIVKATKSD